MLVRAGATPSWKIPARVPPRSRCAASCATQPEASPASAEISNSETAAPSSSEAAGDKCAGSVPWTSNLRPCTKAVTSRSRNFRWPPGVRKHSISPASAQRLIVASPTPRSCATWCVDSTSVFGIELLAGTTPRRLLLLHERFERFRWRSGRNGSRLHHYVPDPGRMDTVRGRFAPSPTGELHLGNARTALLAWLWAKREGGGFTLRIEDLDRPRERPGMAERQISELAWLGIGWGVGRAAV